MRSAVVFLLLLSPVSLLGWNQPEDINVNSRYTVESVNISGRTAAHISPDLRKNLDAVVGQKFDHGMLDRLAGRIRRELRVESVAVRVGRGRLPDHVTVEFEIQDGSRRNFGLHVTKFAYNSRQGWTGAGEATTTISDTGLAFGVVSDGDELVERFAGVNARVERRLGANRVKLRFNFETYHDQWNPATLTLARTSELYRSRRNFEPTVTVVLAEPLTWTVGASYQQLSFAPAPSGPDPGEWSSTATTALRFHRSWEDRNSTRHLVDAGYGIRAASRILGGDYVYVRHLGDFRYAMANGRHELTIDFLAGGVTGRAPMYERFVLGNSSTLRGWSKFDLDPAGADRAVHGSVDYRYRFVTIFYDAGATWSGGTSSGPKQGVGCGLRSDGREGFLLAIAFPLRSGHADPMFIAGFNF